MALYFLFYFIGGDGNQPATFSPVVPRSGLVFLWGTPCGPGTPSQHRLLVAHPGGWNWVGALGAQRVPHKPTGLYDCM